MNLRVTMNHKKIQRIMKKYGLFCKIRRRNPYKNIAKRTAEHRICENKLNRQEVLGWKLSKKLEMSIVLDTLSSLKDTTTFRDRKSTRLNSSHIPLSRMPSSA